MIIELIENVFFDTSLTFKEQTEKCQDFVNNYINNNTPFVEWDEENRPSIYIYTSTNWTLTKTYYWQCPPPSCIYSYDEITCKGNELWHEENMKIQIIMSFENNIKMLELYPEIGVYRKKNNIGTYMVNNFTYSYCNYLLDEHRMLLTGFGGIINERNI